jgi:hypothetical protein
VETVIRIVRVPELSGFFTQGEDFQIPQVIFQVIAGILYNVMIDGGCGVNVTDAAFLQ